MNYGYHITKKVNTFSILQSGLVPNYGFNSHSVLEKNFFVYFTEKDSVQHWIRLLHYNDSMYENLVLFFPCDGYSYQKRLLNSFEYVTSEIIIPSDLSVLLDDDICSLFDYYESNKRELNLLETDNINFLIENVLSYLSLFDTFTIRTDYMCFDPKLFSIIMLIKRIMSFPSKRIFLDHVCTMKVRVLQSLLEGNLNISVDSEIFKILCYLFDNMFLEQPCFDAITMNYLAVLLETNLYYRQLYRRVKYGMDFLDNQAWDIAIIYDHLPIVESVINKYSVLGNLIYEIYQLEVSYSEFIGKQSDYKYRLEYVYKKK